MPPPDRHDVEVATDELRSEAGLWVNQGEHLATAATGAESLRFDRLEAGIFQLLVSSHDAVVDQVQARCSEGQQRMVEIAGALRQSADTYEAEDLKGEHRFRSLY